MEIRSCCTGIAPSGGICRLSIREVHKHAVRTVPRSASCSHQNDHHRPIPAVTIVAKCGIPPGCRREAEGPDEAPRGNGAAIGRPGTVAGDWCLGSRAVRNQPGIRSYAFMAPSPPRQRRVFWTPCARFRLHQATLRSICQASAASIERGRLPCSTRTWRQCFDIRPSRSRVRRRAASDSFS